MSGKDPSQLGPAQLGPAQLEPADWALAPCLRDGPCAEAASELILAARRLGSSGAATAARSWTLPVIYAAMPEILGAEGDPVPLLEALWRRLSAALEAQRACGWEALLPAAPAAPAGGQSLMQAGAAHFGQLFAQFATQDLWERPRAQLEVRLRRNGLDPALFRGQRVLDAGCGSGRMAFLFRLLGARQVLALDLSREGLELCRRRRDELGAGAEVQLLRGSALELPLADESVDVSFSFGVLHHTVDWRRGLAEMVRVTRRGGLGLVFYLNEEPGGLFWDMLEVTRALLRHDPPARARAALEALGVAPSAAIHMLDPALVPINLRLTPAEVEDALRAAGAAEVRRFTRGADGDRIEQLQRGGPYAAVKWGVGENRYVFTRA